MNELIDKYKAMWERNATLVEIRAFLAPLTESERESLLDAILNAREAHGGQENL